MAMCSKCKKYPLEYGEIATLQGKTYCMNCYDKEFAKQKVVVQMAGKSKVVKADIMKLSRTMFNKEGEKYSEKEMKEMGFEKKIKKETEAWRD